MRKIILPIILIALAAPTVYAQSVVPFFEFAPRVSDRLNIASQTGEVLQVFRPQNDFLSGFDFWIDNPGQEGTVLFEFFDNENTVYRSREVIVPSIPKFPNGTRFHVDFSSQAAISNLRTYNIRVTTDLPDFHIYHSNRIYLLQHDQIILSEFDFGGVKIGGATQDYAFKFALYENTEDAPPVLTNITHTNLSLSDTKVSFNANEAVDYKIRWGPQTQGYTQEIGYTDTFRICGEGITTCDLTLSIQPDTVYQYELVAKDEWGNETAATDVFVSADSPPLPPPPEPEKPKDPTQDTTPPVITNIRAVGLTNSSVRIAWTTDEVANSKLTVVTAGEGAETVTIVTDDTIELEHVLQTANILIPNTQYIATASSTDRFNNTSAKSLIFTTLAESPPKEPTPPPKETPLLPPPDQPIITNPPPAENQPTPQNPVIITVSVIEVTPEAQVGEETPESKLQSNATIKWLEPESGPPTDGYRIDLFDADFNLKRQNFVESSANELEIEDLDPGDYYVVVYANNGGVFERIGEIIKFTVEDPHGVDFLSKPWFYLLIVGFVGISIFGLKLEQKRRELEAFGL